MNYLENLNLLLKIKEVKHRCLRGLFYSIKVIVTDCNVNDI